MVLLYLLETSPVHLLATNQVQSFSSPGYNEGQYPNNLDCYWLITTENARQRIYLRVDDSDLDPPLFAVCDDYCAVYDGNNYVSTEISRWCGKKKPYGFISSSDALYIVFHTDERFQGRGIRFLFVEFEVPGCPTGWLPNYSLRTCYTLQTSPTGLTWAEAQAQCAAQRSNLLTITSQQEYYYIIGKFSRIETFARNATIFWIGYSDATDEATFRSIDTSERIWPDQFPVFTKKHDREDCVYINPYSYEGIAYEVASCVSKYSHVCKMRQDGQTIPFTVDTQTIRKGMTEYDQTTIPWSLIILFIIIFAACLIALWYLYIKCQKKKSKNRVGSIEGAGRLVTTNSQQKQQLNSQLKTCNQLKNDPITQPSHVVELYPTKENISTTDQQRAADHVNKFLETFERDLEGNCDTPRSSEQLHELEHFETLSSRTILGSGNDLDISVPNVINERQNNESTQNASPVLQQKRDQIGDSSKHLEKTPSRGHTMASTHSNHQQPTQNRRRSLFDRPNVALLENTSAISLDEFWNRTTS
uniref:CUB domain-containing protein n=1 Tax=Syphacia muris TaxID=451379 RepID=A0A0N5AF86_9BILA